MSDCPYCERPSRADSRGRCVECGAARDVPTAAHPSIMASFQDFVDATEPVWKDNDITRRYNEIVSSQYYKDHGIIFPEG